MFQSDVRNASVTKKLLDALACNIDTTQDVNDQSCKGMSAFYDTMCSEIRGKRPFFSEEFTRDFMEVRGVYVDEMLVSKAAPLLINLSI